MKLIDAERLKAVLEKNFGHTGGASVLEQLIDEQPTVQPEKLHGRIFQEIVVEYPSISNPEHKGKPYFSIKYTENEQGFVGYGTYKPEVLSEYLKEYFIPSVQPEPKWIPVSENLSEQTVQPSNNPCASCDDKSGCNKCTFF